MPVLVPTLKTPARPVSETQPLWYKDAIIYQLHVRAFADSNGDGVGDFPGLTQRLDYIQGLGVTAIWLLPFFPSPLRDDGYDIADYLDINPIYGTLRDFKRFLQGAHRRGLRVITELVMNHTSDQHEWFQRSRRAKPGTKWRDFYVWSETPEKYQDARIIFQDFERSNWTWDPVAGAYFWHRFYHHQPDLNFDNPEVRRTMVRTVDYWLEMGVDGLRLDAVPYLFQQEGTNCENLPETHAFLRELRRHIDERFGDKMLLAEANQWPEDAAAYFGDGDECHMNFHFPLMPRLFMAVQREDRFPVIDILEQTPPVPENCQWAIFLRNHDELTLEMVTDEERDYMYRAYATDPQARVNLGIRRRLAPLMQNDRRKIELMNGLLLSLPGTPIIYYGDEIGMGDNIYLGDRNGVRTPMQWNGDRNAGFSWANPQRLFLPTIIDPAYHYALRNVEVENNNPHSLLWWMRRIIGLRNTMQVFGRGTFEMLTPDGAKVLAFLRQYNDETLLVVANLSRYVQAAELDLSRFRGRTPIELFGQTRFPPIGELPYFLTLGPYAFYWFRIEVRELELADGGARALPSCRARGGWESVFEASCGRTLQEGLAPYLRRHRWFGGKGRTIQSTEVIDQFALPPYQPERNRAKTSGDGNGHRRAEQAAEGAFVHLLFSRVNYVEGEPEYYMLPVVFAADEQADNILGDHPAAGILQVEFADRNEIRTLCEATWEKTLWLPLLEMIVRRRAIHGQAGDVSVHWTKAFKRVWNQGADLQPLHVHAGEQSNTSAVFGNRFILKLFRRLSPGINPDFEIGRFLTERAPDAPAPDVAAAVEYRTAVGETFTLAILCEYVPNEGDAWVYTLDELGRYLERVQSLSRDGALAATHIAAVVGGIREGHAPRDREWSSGHELEDESEYSSVQEVLQASEGLSLLELARSEPPPLALDLLGGYLQSAELLGKRTAQLHVALASGEDAAFVPEPFSQLYQRSLYQSMRTQARRNLDLLRKQLATLDEDVQPLAEKVVEAEEEILNRFRQLVDRKIMARRIRCHSDLHMGQVLYTGKDFVIIDFEGEPERPISERRIKASPLRDVAGMVRSFHYASHATLAGHAPGVFAQGEGLAPPEAWLQFWYVWSSAAFLQAYLAEAERGHFLPASEGELATLLNAYVMEKSLYEVGYELNNRPNWVKIPLEGILQLLE